MGRVFSRLLVVATVLCSVALPGIAWALDEGQVAPDWRLETPGGEELNFYSDSGQNLSIVLFWATWCPYCRSLMPHIQELAEEFDELPLSIYALNVWEDGDPKKYFDENDFNFKLLLRADLVAEDYGVRGTPGLFLIDRKRQVLYKRKSGEDDVELKTRLKKQIEMHISQ